MSSVDVDGWMRRDDLDVRLCTIPRNSRMYINIDTRFEHERDCMFLSLFHQCINLSTL
jgi:hypothetical protein